MFVGGGSMSLVKSDKDVEYDRWGRMKYHPEYHPNQRAPWTTKDQKYLIENYGKSGAMEVSLALGRTIRTVMQRVYELRLKGLMQKKSPKKMKTQETA
jgi:hypothetical protein